MNLYFYNSFMVSRLQTFYVKSAAFSKVFYSFCLTKLSVLFNLEFQQCLTIDR